MSPRLISSCYRVEGELARGGMARVYRVIDERNGQAFALKQLSVSEERSATLRAMFEREYHTLVQLAHPRIVRVFDFGVDGDDPYYVMELLEGVDARQAIHDRQPEIREICLWLRDCASALALVHSRRMVHRDVSPRNLWCTPDGRAKLIDFGTLVAMGPQTRIAGTPPFVPPEAVNAQPLDGRCDLYALGALAYSMLTDRAAFPARSLSELPELWQRRPQRPDAIRSDVPKALADLVMAMLSFDPRGRPASASEVFERLTRIADLPPEDEQSLAQAFLASPKLVGRDPALVTARKRVRRVLARRGSTLAIVAESGLGRSRLLANTILEAKLIGATAITASATAVASGPLGLAAALAERVLESQPLAAGSVLEHAPFLGQLSPALKHLLGDPKPSESVGLDLLRKQTTALFALFRAASRDQPLVVGVDDAHRADSASLAVLGKLSMLANDQRLLLVITCDAGTLGNAPPALEQLVKTRHSIRLTPLAAEHTRELMASLFGEVDGLDEAASWLHEVSQGSPASCLQYAQYLVDQGLARYEGGHWQLPVQLHNQGLPESLGSMFERRVRAMSADARALALCLALARDESRAVWQPESHVAIEDFPKLLDSDSGRAFAALDELLRAGALQQRDQFYVLGQRALVDALLRLTDPEVRRQLHIRVADLYAPRGGQARWVAIRQLQSAGEYERARALLVEAATQLGSSPADFGAMRVSVSADTARTAYTHWKEHGGTPAEGVKIRRLMLIVCSVYDWSLAAFGKEQLAQLSSDCGLVYWDQTDASQPDVQRVLECLKRAGEVHEAKPEAQRGLDPMHALRELAGAAMALSGAAVNSHDLSLARAIPPLFSPLKALSPLLALLGDLSEISAQRLTGHELGDRTLEEGVTKLLNSTGLPDVLRMGASGVNLHIQSIEDARRGRLKAIERIELLTPFVGEDMFLVVHGRWLGHAYRGNGTLARQLFKQVQMITEDDVWRRKSFLFAEAELHALTGDQLLLRGACDAIAELTEKFPGWGPWLGFARAALHRVRGEFAAARAELEPALRLAPPGEHRAWTRLAPAHAEALLLSGDAAEALREATAISADVQRLKLDRAAEVAAERIGALAHAALGDPAAAHAKLERAFTVARELESDGLPLALLYETKARIAAAEADAEGCTDALTELWKLIENADAPALINAYESLRATSQGHATPSLPVNGTLTRSTFDESIMYTHVQTRLAQFDKQQERMRHALSLLLEDSGASSGHLLLLDQQGLFAAAAVNENQADDALLTKAQAFLDTQLEVKTVTLTASEVANDQLSGAQLISGNTALAPVLLIDRVASPPRLVGVALLGRSEAAYRAPRGELVRIVSRCLQEAGDSLVLVLED
ncbi:MAG TPA: protein kinase [Polyangiales bacterium]|nr:protein kinase [Polyangiales bacterium]